MSEYTIIEGDCLDVMPTLPDASCDAIIVDQPYGTTNCRWDTVIPFAPMWEQVKRLAKPRAAVVMFASQPFTSALVMSNPAWFRYTWTWYKNNPVGFQFARFQPMRATEDIAVFYDEHATFNAQKMKSRIMDRKVANGQRNGSHWSGTSDHYSMHPSVHPLNEDVCPWNVLEFPVVPRAVGMLHPTQKPQALLSYLVKTYTNPGDVVLDFAMGSGTTGAACIENGRSFIGIEKERKYFDIARERLAKQQCQYPLFNGGGCAQEIGGPDADHAIPASEHVCVLGAV